MHSFHPSYNVQFPSQQQCNVFSWIVGCRWPVDCWRRVSVVTPVQFVVSCHSWYLAWRHWCHQRSLLRGSLRSLWHSVMLLLSHVTNTLVWWHHHHHHHYIVLGSHLSLNVLECCTVYSTDCAVIRWHSLLCGSVGRTSVFDRRTFPVLSSTCSLWVTIYVGKPSAIGQPTRPTQPFICSG